MLVDIPRHLHHHYYTCISTTMHLTTKNNLYLLYGLVDYKPDVHCVVLLSMLFILYC